jgi:hypothetical protein
MTVNKIEENKNYTAVANFIYRFEASDLLSRLFSCNKPLHKLISDFWTELIFCYLYLSKDSFASFSYLKAERDLQSFANKFPLLIEDDLIVISINESLCEDCICREFVDDYGSDSLCVCALNR